MRCGSLGQCHFRAIAFRYQKMTNGIPFPTVAPSPARLVLVATVGRFSQRTHARPQGWIPVCPVTFFAVWRQVQGGASYRLCCSPPVFGRFPTPTGRFRGGIECAHFFSSSGRPMLLSDTNIFKTSKIGQKSDTNPKIRLCEAGLLL